MYKLIAIDCDGTLLNSKKEISPRTIQAIKIAKNSGAKVVLATARPFYRLKKYLSVLDLISDDQYTICFNGGMVVNNTETETVFFRCFSKKHTYELIKTGNKFNIKIFIYTSEQIYANRDDKLYRKINPDTVFEVVDFEKVKFSEKNIRKIVYYGNPKNIANIRGNLPESLLSQFEISSSVPENIEFVKKGVSKAKGLEKIAEKLDIKSNEIIAFGDHENDIKMMKFAGHSVAMGNAIDEIKSISDEITDTSDNDGVAIVLERIFS